MRSKSDVREVFELRENGCSKSEIARRTGVSRSQVRGWLAAGLDAVLHSPMRERAETNGEDSAACLPSRCPRIASVDEHAYAYLLGQHLGDGMLTAIQRGVFRLRITMCDAYPAIMAECAAAIRAVMPANAVCAIPRRGLGCTEVTSYSKHWICFFPQHGAGRKHLRPIVLEPWQQRIALDRQPDSCSEDSFIPTAVAPSTGSWGATRRVRSGTPTRDISSRTSQMTSSASSSKRATASVSIAARTAGTASQLLVARASVSSTCSSDQRRSARGGTRTRTPFRTMGLESIASASCATRACRNHAR
jgi:hypothetical protein